MKKIPILIPLFLLLIFSCSDAEIISGTYEGKIYRSDTLSATLQVSKVNDGYVRMEVAGGGLSTQFIEYAQLEKNGEEAYNLQLTGSNGYILTGYYYEGFLHIDALTNQYTFEGQIKE